MDGGTASSPPLHAGIYASNSGNDPAGARRGDTSTATPGTARNADPGK